MQVGRPLRQTRALCPCRWRDRPPFCRSTRSNHCRPRRPPPRRRSSLSREFPRREVFGFLRLYLPQKGPLKHIWRELFILNHALWAIERKIHQIITIVERCLEVGGGRKMPLSQNWNHFRHLDQSSCRGPPNRLFLHRALHAFLGVSNFCNMCRTFRIQHEKYGIQSS